MSELYIYIFSIIFAIGLFFYTHIRLDLYKMTVLKHKKKSNLWNIIKIYYFYSIFAAVGIGLGVYTQDPLIRGLILGLIPIGIIFSMFDISKLWIYIRYGLKESDELEYETLKFEREKGNKIIINRTRIINSIILLGLLILSYYEFTHENINDYYLLSPLIFSTFYYFSSFDTKYKNIPDSSFFFLFVLFIVMFFISDGAYEYNYYFSYIAITAIMILVGVYETISERVVLGYMDIPILFFLVMTLNEYSLFLVMALVTYNIFSFTKAKKEGGETYPFFTNITYVLALGILFSLPFSYL